eukprot:974131-Karenia_brevis.AAC.1
MAVLALPLMMKATAFLDPPIMWRGGRWAIAGAFQKGLTQQIQELSRHNALRFVGQSVSEGFKVQIQGLSACMRQ